MFSDTACILHSKHPFFFQTLCDAQLYLVNNSFAAHFVSRSILAVIDHTLSLTFPCFPDEWPPWL